MRVTPLERNFILPFPIGVNSEKRGVSMEQRDIREQTESKALWQAPEVVSIVISEDTRSGGSSSDDAGPEGDPNS